MKLHCVHMNRTEPLKLTQIELWFEECSKINTAISRRASQYHHIEGSIVFLIVSEHIFGIDSNFEVVSNQSDFFLSNLTYILMVWSWAFRCWKNVNQHWEVEELVSAIEESLEGGAVCCLHTGIEEYSDTQNNFSFQHSFSKLNSLMQGYNPFGIFLLNFS